MSDTPVKDEMNMEDLLAESSPVGEVGSVVSAYVVESSNKGLLVDLGLKVEGFIPIVEFRTLPKPPAVGDTIPALIKRMAGPDGHPLASWREARERIHWDRISKAKNEGTPVEGAIVRAIKGGLLVDIGMEGFLPVSQIDRRPVKDVKSFVGKKLPFMVLEMDSKKGSVVVSHRRFQEKEAAVKQEETLKDLEVDKVYEGTVTGISSFGAFIDIGGIEGLLRVSDLSWIRGEKLTDILSVGQKLNVQVLQYDAEAKKISLGRKQLLPHPWDGIESRFPLNAVVTGRVTNVTDFGAFVEIEPGIEGLIHQSEFSWKERWAKPKDFVKKGQEVQVVVLTCERGKGKMSLSLKRAGDNPWEKAAETYKTGSKVTGKVTHLVNFGAFVRLDCGLEGLLRKEDVSWTKTVNNMKDWVTVGQEREFVVLDVNAEAEKISLGLKQLTEDPYSKLKPGRIVEGRVIRLTDSLAVIEIEPDVQGVIHVSEIPSARRLERASDALAMDQSVTAVVIKLNKKSKRVDLSIRKYDKKEERRLLKKYQGGSEGITLGEMTQWDDNEEEV